MKLISFGHKNKKPQASQPVGWDTQDLSKRPACVTSGVVRANSILYRAPPHAKDYSGSVTSRPSRGAPVPDEPMNSLRPSANVRSRPLPLFDPSLAW